MTVVKWICLCFVFGIPIIFIVQKGFRPIFPGTLDGYFEPNPSPVFDFNGLSEGTYQSQMMRHLDRSIGFHNQMVRLHNQLDFSLFRLPNARKVVVGEDDYLYEDQYIKAWSGKDFIGKNKIEARVQQLRDVQDLLWKEKKIFFLVILLPDKGTFYSEHIPSRFRNDPRGLTNYQWYRKSLEKQKVNVIDLNSWFLAMKDTIRYCLYPKTGIHWSNYGACLAMDSLVKYLEIKTGRSLPEMKITIPGTINETRGREDDMAKGMNLICPVHALPMAQPKVEYINQNNEQPFSALFLGDSFYFIWAEAGYIGNVFSNRDFWYYDHDVYYGTFKTGKLASDQDLGKSVFKNNAIILVQTNAGYGCLGYGFVDQLLEAFYQTDHQQKVKKIR
ncbi:MAG: hypothetical protein PHF97_06855 [Bacteroidales bacterium]|nr:hypothetical protein [Bacteroidales bacterium]MDD4603509.1 hypothetical protein [Bacteroidales bacterium]